MTMWNRVTAYLVKNYGVDEAEAGRLAEERAEADAAREPVPRERAVREARGRRACRGGGR